MNQGGMPEQPPAEEKLCDNSMVQVAGIYGFES